MSFEHAVLIYFARGGEAQPCNAWSVERARGWELRNVNGFLAWVPHGRASVLRQELKIKC